MEQVPKHIEKYLLCLTRRHLDIKEIWLYGSGVYNPFPGDWDILIFAEEGVYEKIKDEGVPLELRDELDLFITKEKYNDDEIFEQPWEFKPGSHNRISLSYLIWNKYPDPPISDDFVIYSEKVKGPGPITYRRAKAIRLWARS